MATNRDKSFLNSFILTGASILYIAIAWYTMSHHELWGDEIHSWNIAKASNSFADLLSNTRYEGHPPLWYTILWTVSKFTHDPGSIQVIHLVIACLIAFLVLFFSPFPLLTKLLIPFGYFFLFEYSVLSRNYAIGILMAFCICIIMSRNFKGKTVLYYCLLFLLSNSHLLALVLAASIHLYFLFILKEQGKSKRSLLVHVLTSIAIFIPSVFFILPPPDSSLNTNFWLSRWSANQLFSIVQAPLRSFVPIPNWSEYHFWDTNFLVGKKTNWFIPIISGTLILLAIIVLKKNKKSLYLFLCNFLLIVLLSFIIPFTNARHVGFIFIGFLVALWFYCEHQKLDKSRHLIVLLLLAFQLIGGVIAVTKDVKYPFSNSSRVIDLLNQVSPEQKIVTDYWCLNNLAAFTDKPYYCVDLQREATFLLWNSELKSALTRTDRYNKGITVLLDNESLNKVYMLSIQSPERISQLDNRLPILFDIKIIDKREGAIERGSNLYLYEITPK